METQPDNKKETLIDAQHASAARRNPMLRALGRGLYRIAGWHTEGDYPRDLPKAVVLIAPHTSKWDFFVWFFGSVQLGITGSWLAKHTIFLFPLVGSALRALGGVPIDRTRHAHFVEAAIEAMNTRERMQLVLAPEGTRKKLDHWKSGFYHIARGAKVPVVLAYADYATRTAGIGETIELTGDVDTDLAKIEAFYVNITPYHPEQRSPVRFHDEGG